MPEAGILEQQLYDPQSDNPCGELRKLNRALLAAYTDLLQVCQDSPTECNSKVDEIRVLLLNLQHLINTFRPYQAREDIISALQEQIDSKRQLIADMRDACAECATVETTGEVQDSMPEPDDMEIDAEADRLAANYAAKEARAELRRVTIRSVPGGAQT